MKRRWTRPASADKSHYQVIDHLERHGVFVESLPGSGNGFPDLLVHYKNLVTLIEIKETITSPMKFTQVRFMARYPGRCGIAIGLTDALDLARSDTHLINDQQRFLLQKLNDEFPSRNQIQLNVVLKRLKDPRVLQIA